MPLTVVGGAEVTTRPPPINVDEMFQRGDTKPLRDAEAQGERRLGDKWAGQGPLKLQTE